jgi:hypothetical protein
MKNNYKILLSVNLPKLDEDHLSKRKKFNSSLENSCWNKVQDVDTVWTIELEYEYERIANDVIQDLEIAKKNSGIKKCIYIFLISEDDFYHDSL